MASTVWLDALTNGMSVHEAAMNWDLLWIGEMGASMTSAASREWGTTLLAYMNGKAPGGPVFTDTRQYVSGDWWAWGCLTGQNPNGCVGNDGKVRPQQAPFIDQMLFRPKAARL